MSETLDELLSRCVAQVGIERTRAALEDLAGNTKPEVATLTLIANAGVHRIPDKYLVGEIYEVTHGNFQATTHEGVITEIREALVGLHEKLQEREWVRIFLVPTGHPVVSAQIKTFIYRVTRLNTIDLLYLNGDYFEVDLDHRRVVLDESGS